VQLVFALQRPRWVQPGLAALVSLVQQMLRAPRLAPG
jgi:hypothetical protein